MVEAIEKLIKQQDSKVNKEQYYKICEELGTEPDPEVIPIEISDFCDEFQELYMLFSQLPDRWEGMSGTYLGKDYSILPFLFDMYQIENRKDTFSLITILDNELKKFYHEKQKQRDQTNKAKKGAVKRG